jgi:hypothetical protein
MRRDPVFIARDSVGFVGTVDEFTPERQRALAGHTAAQRGLEAAA